MKLKTSLAVALVAASMVALTAGPSVAAGAAPKVIGTDPVGDWGTNVDPTLAPIGDALGEDLVKASIGMADAKTINFVLQVNSLPPAGGMPEVSRYVWGNTVNGKYMELDGKFTNYSRGACDPTSGQCPPPRDPGTAPFLVRGNCVTTSAGSNVSTCQEIGLVHAKFDAAKATITIPVPLAMIKAKSGSKIAPAMSDFTSLLGGPIVAVPATFLSESAYPADALIAATTFVVP